jgi:hypothetical protein
MASSEGEGDSNCDDYEYAYSSGEDDDDDMNNNYAVDDDDRMDITTGSGGGRRIQKAMSDKKPALSCSTDNPNTAPINTSFRGTK